LRAVIVFDSMFGNTHEIAEAIADGLLTRARVDLFAVDDAPDQLDDDIDLLVVGGPTHGHGLSNRGSRHVTAKQAAQGAVPGRIGLREWLAHLRPRDPVAVATFDTRFAKPVWLTGSAARRAAKLLRERGYVLVVPPESFFVDAGAGPLSPGEADRARRWGEALAAVAATGHIRHGSP